MSLKMMRRSPPMHWWIFYGKREWRDKENIRTIERKGHGARMGIRPSLAPPPPPRQFNETELPCVEIVISMRPSSIPYPGCIANAYAVLHLPSFTSSGQGWSSLVTEGFHGGEF